MVKAELYGVDAVGAPVSELSALGDEMHKSTGAPLVDCYSQLARADDDLWWRHLAWTRAVLSGDKRHLKHIPELKTPWELYSVGRELEQFVDSMLSAADIRLVRAELESAGDDYFSLLAKYQQAIKERWPEASKSMLRRCANRLMQLHHPELWREPEV